MRRAVVALSIALASATPLEGQRTLSGEPFRAADSTTLVMLGTGMPVPSPERSGPATAVVVGDRVFVFDAGPGVMRRIAAAGLPIDGVAGLFLTHLHSDHTLGYPDLIFTTWVMGRNRPMRVAGPPGTLAMTNHILAAWREDIELRTRGLERAKPDGWRVNVLETRGGVVYDSAGVKITAIAVPHGSWKTALGYRIDTPSKSIAISGDIRYSEELARSARGVDILVHEIYDAERVVPEDRPGGELWPQYMKSFHASDIEVGRVAARVKPSLLILYHVVGPWTEQELVDGIRRGGYRGKVVIAKDLDRY